MKNEFILAFNEVLEEKQLPKDIILKALESAMVSAYRRSVNASSAQQVDAKIDPETGKVAIFAEKEIVESVQDPRTEVTLQEARRYNPEAEIGMMVVVESTPGDFGRVAAQTARQVIQQRIRDAERQAQMAFYQKQLGEIVSGVIQAVNAQGLTIGMEMRAEGNMSRKDMIPGERFRIHDRVRALVAEVKDSTRGPQIILSRTHRDFLRRLLENEVPEIYHGVVEIRSIAREPGERAKVAVSATQQGIDPVGACVGIRGVRIQAIVRELHDEKIDVIEWNADPAMFIAKAISPARVVGVYLNERSASGKTATVVVPEDQLSLAIGRDGQNARLAAKLTSWRIDIKSVSEAAADTLFKLQKEPAFAEMAAVETDVMANVETMLAKKADGRPLNPEEYDLMTQFVDRIERRVARRTAAAQPVVEDTRRKEISSALPEAITETNILDSGLPEHVAYILQEAGYATIGEIFTQMKIQPDEVLKLQGIGPRAMSEIIKLIERVETQTTVSAPVEEPVIGQEAPAEEMKTVLTIEETLESPVETAKTVESLTPSVASPEGEVVVAPAETSVKEEEEEPSFDTLFKLRPEIEHVAETEEEEEGESRDSLGKKKKKKGKKHVEVEYDPDRDMTLVRKKHKRTDSGWEWEP